MLKRWTVNDIFEMILFVMIHEICWPCIFCLLRAHYTHPWAIMKLAMVKLMSMKYLNIVWRHLHDLVSVHFSESKVAAYLDLFMLPMLIQYFDDCGNTNYVNCYEPLKGISADGLRFINLVGNQTVVVHLLCWQMPLRLMFIGWRLEGEGRTALCIGNIHLMF